MAASVLLLIAGGVGAWFLYFRETMPPDLALVPADAQSFVSVRAADLWKTDDLLRFRNASANAEPRAEIKRQEAELGLSFDECERITFVFMDVEGASRLDGKDQEPIWWLICLTSRSYDQKKLLEALVPGAVESTYQNKKYHASDRENVKWSLYFLTDRIFVLGPRSGVQACLDHVAGRKAEGTLKAALKEAAAKRPLIAGSAPPAGALEKLRKTPPADGKRYAALLDALSGTATGDQKAALELGLALVVKKNEAGNKRR